MQTDETPRPADVIPQLPIHFDEITGYLGLNQLEKEYLKANFMAEGASTTEQINKSVDMHLKAKDDLINSIESVGGSSIESTARLDAIYEAYIQVMTRKQLLSQFAGTESDKRLKDYAEGLVDRKTVEMVNLVKDSKPVHIDAVDASDDI